MPLDRIARLRAITATVPPLEWIEVGAPGAGEWTSTCGRWTICFTALGPCSHDSGWLVRDAERPCRGRLCGTVEAAKRTVVEMLAADVLSAEILAARAKAKVA